MVRGVRTGDQGRLTGGVCEPVRSVESPGGRRAGSSSSTVAPPAAVWNGLMRVFEIGACASTDCSNTQLQQTCDKRVSHGVLEHALPADLPQIRVRAVRERGLVYRIQTDMTQNSAGVVSNLDRCEVTVNTVIPEHYGTDCRGTCFTCYACLRPGRSRSTTKSTHLCRDARLVDPRYLLPGRPAGRSRPATRH